MTTNASPMSARQALDKYFLDNRARLLDIASFLDRIDRYERSAEATTDYRHQSFMKALKIVFESSEDRTLRVQQLFSDPTTEPLDRVVDGKAYGAWEGADLEDH